MIRRRVISIFLLYLTSLIIGHNTFQHTHYPIDRSESSDHAHAHPHPHHPSDHHHGLSQLSIWDWVKKILGDFEHTDFGENHFELFLKPGNHTGLQTTAIVCLSFFCTSEYLEFPDIDALHNGQRPAAILSFSDPPFLDSPDNRGPPTFS